MKITITKTDDLFEIDGVKVRLWRGVTEGGLPCDIIVQSVRPRVDATQDEVDRLTAEMGMAPIAQPPVKPQEEWSRADWLHHTGTEGPFA